jgi:hypothetical protein
VKLKFTDGVEIDTTGELRIIKLADGFYIVGQGFLCPVDTREEGELLTKKLKGGPSHEMG